MELPSKMRCQCRRQRVKIKELKLWHQRQEISLPKLSVSFRFGWTGCSGECWGGRYLTLPPMTLQVVRQGQVHPRSSIQSSHSAFASRQPTCLDIPTASPGPDRVLSRDDAQSLAYIIYLRISGVVKVPSIHGRERLIENCVRRFGMFAWYADAVV